MRPDDTMQIDYQMNKRELAEMCFRALREAVFRQRSLWVALLVIAIYGVMGVVLSIMITGRPVGAGWCLLLFLVGHLGLLYMGNYRHYIKAGLLNPQRLRVEQGYLFAGLDGGERFPCRSYTVIRKGKRILMIGIQNSKLLTSYIGIPKRAFSSPDEMDAFLWLMANSCLAEGHEAGQVMPDRGGDAVLTFEITEKRWAHIYGEAVQILSDRKLLGSKRLISVVGRACAFGVLLLYPCIRIASGESFLDGTGLYLFWFLIVVGFFLLGRGLRTRRSDSYYMKMLGTGKIQSDTLGWWEVGIRPEEGYYYHHDKYFRFRWSDYCHRFDMGDTLFFFDQNGKHYIFIPKEALGNQEETARFYDYFYQRGMGFQTAPAPKYGWSPMVVGGIVSLTLAGAILAILVIHPILTGISQVISQDFMDMYNGTYDYEEETVPFVFRPEDYPDYMPLDFQIEVLKSLGIEAPDEEEMQQYEQWMDEDDYYRAYIEGTPFVGILGEMGVGDYDEETEEYSYHPSVYWFDFEGWDISEDYLDILKAFQVMGGGDFELTDMKEDLQNVDWDEGTGAILVMFRYNKNAYAFEARMMYDWIDPEFLGFFNEVLEQERNPKRIFYMDDGGQGAILFYNTKAWSEEFYRKTGIRLEALSREWMEPVIPTEYKKAVLP